MGVLVGLMINSVVLEVKSRMGSFPQSGIYAKVSEMNETVAVLMTCTSHLLALAGTGWRVSPACKTVCVLLS